MQMAFGYVGQPPIQNNAGNPHTPFARKAFSDEAAFWNVDEWETLKLLRGKVSGLLKGQ